LYFPTYQPVSTHKNCFFEKPVSNFVYNVVLSQSCWKGFYHARERNFNLRAKKREKKVIKY
jgi:hypothetical protein